MPPLTFSVVKVLGTSAVASAVAIVWAPFLIDFLYRHKLWKKTGGKKAFSGEDAVVFNSLHKEKEVSAPRMGGLLIFVTVVAMALLLYVISINRPPMRGA